jgi:hypothetical protein
MMMESLMMVCFNSALVILCPDEKSYLWKARRGFCWKRVFMCHLLLSHLNCESFETSSLCILIATNHEIAGIDAAIGGPTGHLLEHNVQVIGQIRANLATCKVVYT